MGRNTEFVCRGCRSVVTLPGPAPPGALPEGWTIVSGSAYCSQCSTDAPSLVVHKPRAQRTHLAEVAEALVIDACQSDPELQRAAAVAYESQSFAQNLRSAVEAVCDGRVDGATPLPKPLRRLLLEALGLVSWERVAARLRPERPENESPPDNGDPFSL